MDAGVRTTHGSLTVFRILVVGAPRSGTTLVQSMLAAHPLARSFTESHFFDKCFKRRATGGYRVLEEQLAARARSFAEENGLREPSPEGVDPTAVAGSLVRWLDSETSDAGLAVWVEKTPDHVFRLGLLRGVGLPFHVVHVVRRPEDVIPSLHAASRAWGKPKSLWGCALHWRGAVEASLYWLARLPGCVVAYEELLKRPEETLRAVLASVGLPWSSDVVERHQEAAEDVVGPNESWKARNLGRSSPHKVVKYRRDIAALGRLADFPGRYRTLADHHVRLEPRGIW